MNPTKSMDWFMIPPKILKLAAKELASSLTSIFNLAINSGEYPNSWKRGEWIPVHKKDERTEKRKFKPITVLNTPGNVFEQRLTK